MGNEFVVADPGVCIGCKTCMAACMHKHSVPGDVPVPRLHLVETWTVSAPIVCHQCEDAPCAAACPVGALYHDDVNHRIGIREDRCIGCRSCMMACPYGAINIVSKKNTVSLGNLEVAGEDDAFIVKCDRCVDRPEGPACVQACPTKGLHIVGESQLEDNGDQRREAAAKASTTYSSIPLQ